VGSFTMIEIDLARQLQSSGECKESSWLLCWLVGGIVFMGVGVGSWWWTQSLQEEVDSLLQEKLVKTQSLVPLQERLKNMERYDEQKKLLMTSVERISGQEEEKVWPVTLLDGISRSADGLDIWLERVQLEAQIVELHGQSLNMEDIGKFIEGLENDQFIMSLPVVEILDPSEKKSETLPFMIRFVFKQKAAT
jgi:Tfp pilus assembly protein PilN